MKKLILILLLFVSANFAQSELTLLFNDSPPNGYEYFKTSDGEYFKTSDNEYFAVKKTVDYTWYYATYFSDIQEDLAFSSSQYIGIKESERTILFDTTFGLRDPSIIQVRDTFFCVMTKDAFANPCQTFAVLKSANLIDWEYIATIDVTAFIPAVNKVWAPEWYVDDDSIYVMFAATTQNYNGWGGLNFQLYKIVPETNNMLSFGNFAKITVTGKTEIIDPFIYKENNIYYLLYIVMDGAHTATYVEIATSNNINSAFTPVNEGNWAGFGMVEGASLFAHNGGYVLFMDIYKYDRPRMSFSTSDNILTGWRYKRDLNRNVHHGTPIKLNSEGNIVR